MTEGQGALKRLSGSSGDLIPLRLAVAAAQGKLGRKAEAAASVQPLLASVTAPMRINDVTYLLADANIDLPAAAAAQQKALKSLEQDSTGWTLLEAPFLLNRKQASLAAAWDTMAWILHHQGKDAEALPFNRGFRPPVAA